MKARRWLVTVVLCCATHVIADEPAPPEAGQPEVVQMNEQEAAFAKLLSGAKLRGTFTIAGRNDADGKPLLAEEAYDLTEVRKLPSGWWQFTTRIRYGEHDVSLPLALPLEWAGDTPVVVVDNVGFPGLGTYSARVLFHGDRYAGYWQGNDHGGHLFGTITRDEPAR